MSQFGKGGNGSVGQCFGDLSPEDGRNGVLDSQSDGDRAGDLGQCSESAVRHPVGVDLGLVLWEALQRNSAVCVFAKAVVDVYPQDFRMQRVERGFRCVIVECLVKLVEGVSTSASAVRKRVVGVVVSDKIGRNHNWLEEIQRAKSSRAGLFGE